MLVLKVAMNVGFFDTIEARVIFCDCHFCYHHIVVVAVVVIVVVVVVVVVTIILSAVGIRNAA